MGLHCHVPLARKAGRAMDLVRQRKPIQQTRPDEKSSPPSEGHVDTSCVTTLLHTVLGAKGMMVNETNKALAFVELPDTDGLERSFPTSFIYLL